MRKKHALSLFVLLSCLALAIFTGRTEAPIRIKAASATSSSPDSLPVTYLVDSRKEGYWQPGSIDNGEGEGLFFQFEKPVMLNCIKVKIKDVKSDLYFEFYLDGKVNTSKITATKQESDDEPIYLTTYGEKSGKDRIDYVLKVRSDKDPIVNSVFIKVAYAEVKPEVVSVRFYQRGSDKPLQAEVPAYVKGSVSPTSTLDPVTAYNAHNLFDSKVDFAWATDGKQTDGIGQSLTINLSSPQDLSGIMIWNGYQRSETHYLANSRPAKIEATVNNGKSMSLSIQDRMGSQVLKFGRVETAAAKLVLKVTDIYRGTKYRDLVLSELRLLDANGKAIILDVPPITPKVINPRLQGMLDKQYTPLLMGLDCDYYPHRTLRIRSNGSFVSYCNGSVLEGNWEPTVEGLKLFGRKYHTDPRSSEYMQAVKAKIAVSIFQNTVEIIDPAKLTYAECRKYLQTVLVERKKVREQYRANKEPVMEWWVAETEDKGNAECLKGRTDEELLRKAYDVVVKRKVILLYSPLFTDFFLPNEELDYYSMYGTDEP